LQDEVGKVSDASNLLQAKTKFEPSKDCSSGKCTKSTKHDRRSCKVCLPGKKISSASRKRWKRYVKATAAAYAPLGGIQPACAPRMHKHSGKYKGAVMLFHGFTACPQQWNDLVPLLTGKGFTVFTPLLLGHGAVYKEVEVTKNGVVEKVIEDNIDLMPDKKEEHHKFAEEMNAIMAWAGGETVIMGLSLGGAVATYAGTKYDYTRQLLAVPLMEIAADNAIIQLLRRVNSGKSPLSGLRTFRFGFGAPCEGERAGGRAGICQFNLRKIMAGRDLGHDALKVHVRGLTRAQVDGVQVVFTEGDGAVSVQAVQKLATKLGARKGSGHSCGFDKAIGHSFLSAFDTPQENKYWLSEVTRTVAAFLTDGTPFEQEGVIDDWPRCKLTCTPESCPYHAAAGHIAVAPANKGLLVKTAEELEAQLAAE